MSKQKIFISHTRKAEDRDWARRLAQQLQERGFSVWLDDLEIRPGEQWQDKIEQGLRNSDVIVSLVDAEDVENPSLLFELGAALSLNKRLVPIVPEQVNPSQLPSSVRNRRYLLKLTPEKAAEELAEEDFV